MSLNTLTFPSPGAQPTRTFSLETLNPSFAAASRSTSLFPATFNLVSTVTGGGILSLPFAYATTGVLLTSAYVVTAAAAASFSLYILCSCSRRTGSATYGDVVAAAFGPRASLALEAVLCLFLFFVSTAYMVLIRDIFSSLVPGPEPNVVLLVCVGLCFPCMLMR